MIVFLNWAPKWPAKPTFVLSMPSLAAMKEMVKGQKVVFCFVDHHRDEAAILSISLRGELEISAWEDRTENFKVSEGDRLVRVQYRGNQMLFTCAEAKSPITVHLEGARV